MVNTNKFWCISFAANRERFSFLFVFFFCLFLSLFRLVLCYRASHPSLSVEIFSTYLSISIHLFHHLSFIIHLYHHLSLIIHLFHHLSLLLSTSFIFSLSYYYFFDAALLVCACCNSYFVLLGQICFSHFFSPFSQTNYYSRQEISTNLPVKIVM